MTTSCDEENGSDDASDADETDDGERACDSTGIGKEAKARMSDCD